MEIISKISKGSRMDQIYIPRNRSGFNIGEYVIIKPIKTEEEIKTPYFVNTAHLEPIKIDIINRIFHIINEIIRDYENIIITGSFLEKGFNFNDIDILVIYNEKLNISNIKIRIEKEFGIKPQILLLDNKTLVKGLETDPLYSMMLSRCVANKRFIYKKDYKIDYKILDLHLLKSKTLIENFDYLNGNEKYYLTRNMMAISLFLKHNKINKENLDKEIIKIFGLNINEIKNNMLNKVEFLRKYKKIYNELFARIMLGIKNESKQEQIN